MKKHLFEICIAAAVLAIAAPVAQAGTSKDETLTIPVNTLVVTNTFRFRSGGAALQRISIAAGTMDATVTNAFVITSTDGGVPLALYSGNLTTGGTATTYPRLYGGTTNEALVVQDICIINTLTTTNTTACAPRVFVQSR